MKSTRTFSVGKIFSMTPPPAWMVSNAITFQDLSNASEKTENLSSTMRQQNSMDGLSFAEQICSDEKFILMNKCNE